MLAENNSLARSKKQFLVITEKNDFNPSPEKCHPLFLSNHLLQSEILLRSLFWKFGRGCPPPPPNRRQMEGECTLWHYDMVVPRETFVIEEALMKCLLQDLFDVFFVCCCLSCLSMLLFKRCSKNRKGHFLFYFKERVLVSPCFLLKQSC